ncbi:restriction endonuclease subunit S [Helicobacter pylori]|uniref:restriction endonuclease subunit S n=1 Tax=Helicobacter pylori TaxID=210 RepID=UPI0000D83B50|nr:restriction endonuclease subunit S [Helicobacter pylori]ABF85511.1 type II restriction enzyme [Helicobacter pylori HPAG1]
MIGPLSSQLNAIKWGEFSYETIYELQKTTKLLSKKDCVENGKIPLFTSDSKNNGIVGYVNCKPSYKLKNNQCMVVFGDHTRTFNIAKNDFCIADNVKVLKPIKDFSIRVLLFINTMWGKKIIDKGYARHWSLAKTAKIQLPLKPTAKTQTLEDIDFDFMEKFIAELEQCRLAELEAYLKATGLENTTLSSDEENALNVFNNSGNTPCGLTWQSFKLGDLFEIEKTLSFNKDALTQGQDYDYITRTSQNQGVSQTTGFVNAENLNPPFTWSLGLLQMDFFYRKKSWYAGQFMRKITPKTEIENKIDLRIAHYFTTLLNALKRPLLSVLVRDIDKTFREQKIQLPLKPTANTQTLEDIDFDFMRTLINALMKQTIQGVAQYCDAKIQATKEAISQETPIQKDSLF